MENVKSAATSSGGIDRAQLSVADFFHTFFLFFSGLDFSCFSGGDFFDFFRIVFFEFFQGVIFVVFSWRNFWVFLHLEYFVFFQVNIFLFFGYEYFEFFGHWPKPTLGPAPGDVSSKLWRRAKKIHIYPGYQCWGGGRSNFTNCKQEWSGKASSVQVSGATLAEDSLSSICCPAHESKNEISCVSRRCSSGGVRQA